MTTSRCLAVLILLACQLTDVHCTASAGATWTWTNYLPRRGAFIAYALNVTALPHHIAQTDTHVRVDTDPSPCMRLAWWDFEQQLRAKHNSDRVTCLVREWNITHAAPTWRLPHRPRRQLQIPDLTNAGVSIDSNMSNITVRQIINITSRRSTVNIREQNFRMNVVSAESEVRISPAVSRVNLSVTNPYIIMNASQSISMQMTTDRSEAYVIGNRTSQSALIDVESGRSNLSIVTPRAIIQGVTTVRSNVHVETWRQDNTRESITVHSEINQTSRRRELMIVGLTTEARLQIYLVQGRVRIIFGHIRIEISGDDNQVIIYTGVYEVKLRTVLAPFDITVDENIHIQSENASVSISSLRNNLTIDSLAALLHVQPENASVTFISDGNVVGDGSAFDNTIIDAQVAQSQTDLQPDSGIILSRWTSVNALLKTPSTNIAMQSQMVRLDLLNGFPLFIIEAGNASIEIRRSSSLGSAESRWPTFSNIDTTITSRPVTDISIVTSTTSRITDQSTLTTTSSVTTLTVPQVPSLTPTTSSTTEGAATTLTSALPTSPSTAATITTSTVLTPETTSSTTSSTSSASETSPLTTSSPTTATSSQGNNNFVTLESEITIIEVPPMANLSTSFESTANLLDTASTTTLANSTRDFIIGQFNISSSTLQRPPNEITEENTLPSVTPNESASNESNYTLPVIVQELFALANIYSLDDLQQLLEQQILDSRNNIGPDQTPEPLPPLLERFMQIMRDVIAAREPGANKTERFARELGAVLQLLESDGSNNGVAVMAEVIKALQNRPGANTTLATINIGNTEAIPNFILVFLDALEDLQNVSLQNHTASSSLYERFSRAFNASLVQAGPGNENEVVPIFVQTLIDIIHDLQNATNTETSTLEPNYVLPAFIDELLKVVESLHNLTDVSTPVSPQENSTPAAATDKPGDVSVPPFISELLTPVASLSTELSHTVIPEQVSVSYHGDQDIPAFIGEFIAIVENLTAIFQAMSGLPVTTSASNEVTGTLSVSGEASTAYNFQSPSSSVPGSAITAQLSPTVANVSQYMQESTTVSNQETESQTTSITVSNQRTAFMNELSEEIKNIIELQKTDAQLANATIPPFLRYVAAELLAKDLADQAVSGAPLAPFLTQLYETLASLNGSTDTSGNRTAMIRNITISNEEITALQAFLLSLIQDVGISHLLAHLSTPPIHQGDNNSSTVGSLAASSVLPTAAESSDMTIGIHLTTPPNLPSIISPPPFPDYEQLTDVVQTSIGSANVATQPQPSSITLSAEESSLTAPARLILNPPPSEEFLLSVGVKVKRSQIADWDFLNKVTDGLKRSYLEGRRRQLGLQPSEGLDGLKRRPTARVVRNAIPASTTANDTIQIRVTSVDRKSPDEVLVRFYVLDEGHYVEADKAKNTFKEITSEEMSAAMSYPVIQPVDTSVVKSPVTTTTSALPTWAVVLLVILLLLLTVIIILTTLFCYKRRSRLKKRSLMRPPTPGIQTLTTVVPTHHKASRSIQVEERSPTGSIEKMQPARLVEPSLLPRLPAHGSSIVPANNGRTTTAEVAWPPLLAPELEILTSSSSGTNNRTMRKFHLTPSPQFVQVPVYTPDPAQTLNSKQVVRISPKTRKRKQQQARRLLDSSFPFANTEPVQDILDEYA